ncbi:hypothetical protein V6N13_053822 [Hibiscus sabdariffa]
MRYSEKSSKIYLNINSIYCQNKASILFVSKVGVGSTHYMSAEFGTWYVEGSLDMEYINVLKEQCWRKIYGMKVATLEGIADVFKRRNVETTCGRHCAGFGFG